MFKLKKLVAAALAGVMMIAAAGCGGGADGGADLAHADDIEGHPVLDPELPLRVGAGELIGLPPCK